MTLTAEQQNLVVIACVAILTQIPAYIKAQTAAITALKLAEKVGKNETAIQVLANGGGDAKIDERLTQHGLSTVATLPPTTSPVAHILGGTDNAN